MSARLITLAIVIAAMGALLVAGISNALGQGSSCSGSIGGLSRRQ